MEISNVAEILKGNLNFMKFLEGFIFEIQVDLT